MLTRDSQRAKVYKWELQAFANFHEGLTLQECHDLLQKIWQDYKIISLPPRIVDGRGTRVAKGGCYRISLPRWARNKGTVLHEIAHSILSITHNWKEGYAGHGPEFVLVLMDLQKTYGGQNTEHATEVANLHKVKIATHQELFFKAPRAVPMEKRNVALSTL